ncbi:c-type cytochrome [Idiomarina xiamenensis]|uniref:Cytochrome c556 n=1 Tax=Idiomarina xiamenensis 10-D-4 TaxID=740709 RepID=K2K935_9GAMM|nr:cytochrome c [Idiomarina xiamenensis]EKE84278.1 cytochrome c556 [Idiomarina xiamenensis 10-D-4]
MSMPFKKTISAVIAACCLTPALAQHAFNDAESAVEYRQKALSIMRDNFAAMGDMVKGEVDYDASIFSERATDFTHLTSIPWSAFSVEGAMPGDGSDALPAIWDNWEDFQQRAEQLQSDAKKLQQAAASGSLDTIKPAFMAVARNCKGCHDNYKD